jgi:hypothetical protein
METKFQTSFIPKKPLVADNTVHVSHSGTSVLMVVAVLLFIVSIAGAAFTFVWKNVLTKAQENYKIQLAESEKRFNTSLIENLKRANTKIDVSKQLLSNHLAVSEVFSIISKLTIAGVRFSSFDFSAPTKDSDGIKVSMKGVGNSFSAIAFQSSVFGKSQLYGSNKVLRNPILSDLALDQNGNVGFTFTTTINPADLSYSKILDSSLQSEGAVSTSTNQ